MMTRYIESFARYGGITAIFFEWLAVVLFFAIKPELFSGQYPISHFATLPETRFIFSICLLTAALSFWIFTRFHLRTHYEIPVRLFTLSMLGYAALALTPLNPDDATSSAIHQILALLFSLTFLSGIYLVGRKNQHNKQIRVISYSAVLVSGLVMTGFFFVPNESSLILPFEAASAFVCQVWVVWISLHSFRIEKEKRSPV